MSNTSEDYKVKGNNFMKNMDYKGAVKNYSKGLALDPRNAILNCNMAQAYLNLNKYEEAEEYANIAIEIQEDYVKAYYRAAKGALGRQENYVAMRYLIQGVQNCACQDLEDLFIMAREINLEFEMSLRGFQRKETDKVKEKARAKANPACKEMSKAGGHIVIAKNDTDNLDDAIKEDDRHIQCEYEGEKKKKKKKKNKHEQEGKKQESEKQERIKQDSGSLERLNQDQEKLQEIKKQKDKIADNMKLVCAGVETLKQASKRRGQVQEKVVEVNMQRGEIVGKMKLGSVSVEEKKQLEESLERLDQEGVKLVERKKQDGEKVVETVIQGIEKQLEKKIQKYEIVDKMKLDSANLEEMKQVRESQDRLDQEREKLQERLEQEREKLDRPERMKKERKEQNIIEQERETKRKKIVGLHRLQSKKDSSQDSLKNDLLFHSKEGSLAFFKGLNRKAIDNFKKALDILQNHPPFDPLSTDLIVLQFAYSQALILSDEYSDIVSAIQILEGLQKEGKHIKVPAILLLLGRAYVRLNRFKRALLPFKAGLSLLHEGSSFPLFPWPGTDVVIDFTDKTHLKSILQNELQVFKVYHKPDAVCFYEQCLDLSQHIVPSQNICYSDPDFAGFVTLTCQERCHICFHIACWKEYKEQLSSIRKLSEKDFLGRACITPDCKKQHEVDVSSIIVKVSIIGADGAEKSSCEYSLPSSSCTRKESDVPIESPKKKNYRKREIEKGNHISPKKTWVNSRNDDVSTPSRGDSSNRLEYSKAITLLATARKNNFGYDENLLDPEKVAAPSQRPLLDSDAEFVYTYFLEIFKEQGSMSIPALREHWEANKGNLPVLEPTIITHTDLIKFLLDAGGFAVIHETIGMSSELPKMSAFVEMSVEAPEAKGYSWKPSSATILEASKTLSFTSNVSQFIEPAEETDDNFDLNASDHINICSDWASSENNRCSITEQLGELESYKSSKLEGRSTAQNFDSHIADEAVRISGTSNGLEDPSLSEECKTCFKINNTEENIDDGGTNEFKSQLNSITYFMKAAKPETDYTEDPSNSNSECSQVPLQGVEMLKSHKEKLTSNNNGSQSADINAPQQTSWQPRRKLLLWALETFPTEPKTKVKEALTFVRAQNHYTLSGLTVETIEERVLAALSSSEYADF